MIADPPPALIFMGGALLVPFLRGRARSVLLLALPLIVLAMIHSWPEGPGGSIAFLDYDLIPGRMDRLSRPFGYIFALISFLGFLFALKVEDNLQHAAALVYAGGALGVIMAGDFFSLYVFWEIMALASTFLILASRTREARQAAWRYVMVHLAGGLILLAGILMRLSWRQTIEVGHIGLYGLDSWLIFLGIAVNAAIPPLHPWLKDAYPRATPTGAVFLSAFTTKSAVYLMARTFCGAEILIWLGAVMTFWPIFYAVLENDIRGVLSYSLINQVGFMMCGIGLGTHLAINGVVSHAFCHIIYKALLFMAAGSVLQMTGKIRCTDLGGLYKYMPLTCLFCLIGAASISAFPLFSGFVSKSMIVSAAGHAHLVPIWLALQFASAGVFHHAGIKVPYFMFFSHDSGLKTKEPPKNMLLAMGLAAFLCVALGIYPRPLYDILPFPVEYLPYTGAHVVGQLQLLMFGALAFTLLIGSGLYPAEMRALNLDTDWFYRKGARFFYTAVDKFFNTLNLVCHRLLVEALPAVLYRFLERGPVILAVLFLTPLYRLTGAAGRFLEMKKSIVRQHIDTQTVPVGLTAAAATAMVVVLFMILQ